MDLAGLAAVAMTVTGCLNPPVLSAAMAGLTMAEPAADLEAGDLERCIAWAWLELRA